MRTLFSFSAPALLLAATAATAVSQNPAPAPAKPDSSAVGAGLDSLRARYIRGQLAGDGTAIAALHTDDAGLDLFGAPHMRGRAAIEAGMKANYGARKYTVTDINVLNRIVRTNDAASELGTYHNMYDSSGTTVHAWGRYVGSFGKGADGQWRINYLMAFPDSTKADKKVAKKKP